MPQDKVLGWCFSFPPSPYNLSRLETKMKTTDLTGDRVCAKGHSKTLLLS